jgi:glycosyltransferase involved in cell wall biosynthesis
MSRRVLLSAYACRPNTGSEPGVGWNWARHLARTGADVWVLTRSDNRAAIERNIDDDLRAKLHFAYVDYPSVSRVTGSLPLAGSWKHLAWQGQAYAQARLLDREIGFDVVHHVSYTSLHIGSQLWRLDCPLIFGPIGGGQLAPAAFRRYFTGGWRREWLRSFVVRNLSAQVLNARSTVRGAQTVLVANADTNRAVRKLGARDVRFMTDVGLDAADIRPHAVRTGGPLRLLWVGRLLPRKGVLLAIEALSLVKPGTDWRLTILGDGEQAPLLHKAITRHHLESKIEWRGHVQWAEVTRSYDEADAFVFTSLRDTNGSQVLEALGRGVPVLTLDHQGAGALVPDAAGIKIPVSRPAQTAQALAAAIERCAEDRDLICRMSAAALEAARAHTWERKVADVLAIYEDVLGNAQRDAAAVVVG